MQQLIVTWYRKASRDRRPLRDEELRDSGTKCIDNRRPNVNDIPPSIELRKFGCNFFVFLRTRVRAGNRLALTGNQLNKGAPN